MICHKFNVEGALVIIWDTIVSLKHIFLFDLRYTSARMYNATACSKCVSIKLLDSLQWRPKWRPKQQGHQKMRYLITQIHQYHVFLTMVALHVWHVLLPHRKWSIDIFELISKSAIRTIVDRQMSTSKQNLNNMVAETLTNMRKK